MKVKDVVIGEQYAVGVKIPAAARMPAVTPIIHAQCLDIAGNTVVLDYETMICDPSDVPAPGDEAAHAGLIGHRRHIRGRRMIRVQATDVVCPSSEFVMRQPDGRVDGEVPLRKHSRNAQTRFPLL